MLDFTFLKKDQIWGNDALDVMKRYGGKVAPTDLAVILGGYMIGGDDRTSEGNLACTVWSASPFDWAEELCIDPDGHARWGLPHRRRRSARPTLPPSEVSKISPSIAQDIDGIRVVEYGEYPQTVADEHTSEKLEKLHSSRSLRPTGKNYTFDSVGLYDYGTPFKATSYPEYEMDGKRYIRVPGRSYANEDSSLSIGEQVENGKPYWVEVQPIEWLMDKSGWMVAKKCLFAGIQFDIKKHYDGDFSKTFMKHYLDTYFAKEMEPTEHTISRDKEKSEEVRGKTKSNDEIRAKIEKRKGEYSVTAKALDSEATIAVVGKRKGKYSVTTKALDPEITITVKGNSGR